MLRFSLNRRNYLFLQSALILLLGFVSYFVGDFYITNYVTLGLLLCVLIVTFIGIIFGLSTSLVAAGVIVAITGSIYVWYAYFVTQVSIPPVSEIATWLVILIVAGLIPGGIGRWASTITEENNFMKEKFTQLVTIDPDTGFENKQMLPRAIELEFHRARRTKQPFTLLLIKIEFFPDFKKLYGEIEANYLIRSMAEILSNYTRICDRKFRVAEDTFAVLLVNASEDDVSTVTDRMLSMTDHRLFNKSAKVKLTLSFGHTTYTSDHSNHLDIIDHAQGELQHYVQ